MNTVGRPKATWVDRLVAVVTPDGQHWRYRYDPLGRRIAKQRLAVDGAIAGQVAFAWDGTVLAEQIEVGERDQAGRTTVWNWEPGTFRPVSQLELASLDEASQEWVDEQFYAIVTDLVGTPTELIDSDGSVAWHHRTTLWGAALSGSTASGGSCPLRFPGQYHDSDTGLNYNYFRYYQPATAGYASSDPIGLAGGANPSCYVFNPLTWVDPFGLTPCPAARFITDASGTTIDRASIATRVSPQKQARHLKGTPEYSMRGGQGSYFDNADDAQRVLDDFHSGTAEVLGVTRNEGVLVRNRNVTGFNNNPGAGHLDQPTNVFIIKGTSSPSVVPTSPTATPR